MDLELSDDQAELRSVARQALDTHSPLTRARAFLDGAPTASPLHELLGELGWYGVGLEADDGFGVVGLVLLAEQVGAHAAPTVLVDSAVSARLANAAGHRAGGGELPIALAVCERESDWALDGVRATVSAGRLTGEKLDVQHAHTVAGFCVLAEDADTGAIAVAFVDRDADGVEIGPRGGADPASAAASVAFSGAPVAALLTGAAAEESIRNAFAVGAVAAAAEGLGAASAALDMSIAYANERRQFGVLIGSFQSLKHLLAGAHVDRESAQAALLYAACALDEGLPNADETVMIAKAYAARASRTVVEVALQVLGGIAFTWEHDVHLLQRRVLNAERRFGDAILHEARIGDQLAGRVRELVP